MNKQPVSYLQTDKRWSGISCKCKSGGGVMNLGRGGCGPTCAAMLVSTLTGQEYTPTGLFKWACENGYVTAGQGTSYDYFYKQFLAFGLDCGILTWAQCMSATSPVRGMVEKKLRDGYYFIALMKKGLWTSGGHYVVVWWADDKIRINDPASTRDVRVNGDPDTFFSQAKYFWQVDARDYNREDEDDVKRYQTLDEIKQSASWAAATVEKLVGKKIIGGNGTGLDLSEDMLRLLVFNDRAGVYN